MSGGRWSAPAPPHPLVLPLPSLTPAIGVTAQAEAASAFLREQEAVRKQFREQRVALSREHDAEIERQQAREAEIARLHASVDKLGGVVREHLEDAVARVEGSVGRAAESSAAAFEGLREAFAEHAAVVKREAARGADAALKAAAEVREVQEARVLKLETEVEAERERREDAERDQDRHKQDVERLGAAEQRVKDLEEQCSLAKQTIAVRARPGVLRRRGGGR